MKLGIIGAGMIVKDFLTISQDLPDVTLEAIIGVEQDLSTMQALQSQYGIETIYTDYDAALEDGHFDTVYVAVPNHLHYAFALKGLEAGKNVICEKPFTLNLKQLQELKRVALANDLILIEAITNQYLTNYQGIKDAIEEIGDVKLIECNYSQYSSRYDAFKEGTILPAFNPKMGGGALMDINIYNIHLVVGLLGKPERINYYANVKQGIDTSGILILDYGDIKVSCIGSKDSIADIRTTIQGDKGSIVLDGPTNIINHYTFQLNKQTPIEHDNKVHPHRMYEEFVAFTEIINHHNTEAALRAMDHSEMVMEIVDRALEDAGITLG